MELPRETKNPYWREPMLVFIKVSSWIAGPVLIALFLGQFLDKKWGTEPWAFLGCTGIAFIFSCFGIVKEARGYMERITKESEEKK